MMFALQPALECLAGRDRRLELPRLLSLDLLAADAPDVLVAPLDHLGDLGVGKDQSSGI